MAIAERVQTGEVFIELTLTEVEAETLWLVCRHIGGDPQGRRGDMDDIRRSLSEAGIGIPEAHTEAGYFDPDFGTGSVHFD